MKSKIFFVFIAIQLGIVACKPSSDWEIIDFTNPTVLNKAPKFDLEKAVFLNFYDLEDIGVIKSVKFYHDEIFLMEDGLKNSIVVLDAEGNFKRRLLRLGMGPGEYSQIEFFLVAENKILIYDRLQSKLLRYDLNNLDFTDEIKLNDLYLKDGVYSSDLRSFLFISDSETDEMGLSKGYVIVSSDFKTIDCQYQAVATIEAHQFQNFSQLEDNFIYITQPFSELVYRFGGTALFPSYQVDFGKRKIPSKVLKLEDAYDFYDLISESNYRFAVHNFNMNKDFVSFNFYQEDIASVYFGIRDLVDYKSFIYRPKTYLEEVLYRPLQVYEGQYISIIDPSEFDDKELMDLGLGFVLEKKDTSSVVLFYKFGL